MAAVGAPAPRYQAVCKWFVHKLVLLPLLLLEGHHWLLQLLHLQV